MPTVRISYNRDKNLIGTTREVSDDEARELVREGRAAIVESEDDLMGKTKQALLRQAAQSNVAVSQSATKDDIVTALRDAQTSDATAAAPGGAGSTGGGTGTGTAGTGAGPGAATGTTTTGS